MITFQQKPYKDEEIFKVMHPLVKKWFGSRFESFTLPQKYALLNIHNRKNTLICAPTGSGKTLTAFLSIINELVNLSKRGNLEDNVYCVYVSPLKALNNDIERNLKEPLDEIEQLFGVKSGIRIFVRTGDTPTSQRAKMLKNPPHILITTPETLAIVLCAPKFRDKLKDVKWVIVDEIHSLAENKRGSHLSITVERLQRLSGRFCRVGLSATVSPLDCVAEFLVGYEKGESRDCIVVNTQFLKKLDLKVLTPVENIMTAKDDEIHGKLYNLINKLVQEHKSTLIFTNTRSATERVVHYLKEKYPGNYIENIGAHHSSLSKGTRLDVENRLKNGDLKVVVSSTSLELGIDIGYIDLVILLGSPKSVARALQRVGRSGHRIHETSKGRIIVMDRDDLVECSVILKDAIEGRIDDIYIPENALDVLSQQIYGICIEGVQYIENVYEMIKCAYPYRNLSREEFDSILHYLSGGYAALEDRYVYAKIWVDYEAKDNEGVCAGGMMGKRGKLARVLYSTNIGTIPDESYITVKAGDEVVGKLDTGFFERLKPGDIFVLGGKLYLYRYVRGQTLQVSSSYGPPTVPSWFSQQLPLSYALAVDISRFRALIEEKFILLARGKLNKSEIINFINNYLYVDENSANSIYEYFREQFLFAKIPNDKKIVIEHYDFLGRKYVIFHTLFGRRTNDALSRAVAYVIAKRQRRDVMISLSDNGFYISSGKQGGKIQTEQAFYELANSNLREILVSAIEKTDLLVRRFRHCAGRSLMILRNYKGIQKSVGKQQISSKILMSLVKRISEHFPILEEARREILEDVMDIEHAKVVLDGVKSGKIEVVRINTDIPSPFALNLIAQGFMDILRAEDRREFIRRMYLAVRDRIERGD